VSEERCGSLPAAFSWPGRIASRRQLIGDGVARTAGLARSASGTAGPGWWAPSCPQLPRATAPFGTLLCPKGARCTDPTVSPTAPPRPSPGAGGRRRHAPREAARPDRVAVGAGRPTCDSIRRIIEAPWITHKQRFFTFFAAIDDNDAPTCASAATLPNAAAWLNMEWRQVRPLISIRGVANRGSSCPFNTVCLIDSCCTCVVGVRKINQQSSWASKCADIPHFHFPFKGWAVYCKLSIPVYQRERALRSCSWNFQSPLLGCV
jgi:hypothetical protein